MSEVVHRTLVFDRFILDITRGCLYADEQDIGLRPKTYNVLRHLAENAGRLVPKEELYEVIWPNVIVSDDSLVQCIRELRQKLGDAEHRLIKTVARRGYLLDTQVSSSNAKPNQVSHRNGNRAIAGRPLPSDEVGLQKEQSLPGRPNPTKVAAIPNIERESSAEAPCEQEEASLRFGSPLGERKQITALCADLKDTLELLAKRDPESAVEIFDATMRLMTQAVGRYEGIVNFTTSDGIMALFGVPLTQEDHAIRACYAALEIQDTVKQYAQSLDPAPIVPIQIRVSLNSGEVITRPTAGGSPSEVRAIGQTTQLAARLAQSAAPGSILVSAETLRLAETFAQVAALERPKVIGLDQPLFDLVGTGPERTRFQALLARGLSKFVGRATEMGQLQRARLNAEHWRGQVVAIIGEAGVGKSRLLHEFIHSNRSPDWLVFEAASLSYRSGTSYLPIIELLKTYAKIDGKDDSNAMRSKLTNRLLDLDRSLARDLVPLAALLDISTEDISWTNLDSNQRRERTLEALKRLIFREAERQPVIVTFEDLHWIDDETQAFLETVIESVPSARLLLILTYRPEYEHRWASKSYYNQLHLDVLSPQTTEEFVSNLVGADATLVSLKNLLPKHGNPFFLEETIRTLIETKFLEGARGHYRLARPLEELHIPSTVQAILSARIDRLPPSAKRLLQAASVVGKDIPLTILQPITGLEEGELRLGLTKLKEAEFLYEVSLFPEVAYTFKHAITHEIAYGTLLGEQRRAFHERIVDAMERLYPDRIVEHVESLALHALQAELQQKAVGYLEQAGQKAIARSALQDARTWLERALDVLNRLPTSDTNLQKAFKIHLELRPVLYQLGEIRLSLARLHEAHSIAEQLNDENSEGQVFAFFANAHTVLGELHEAILAGHRALDIAERLGNLRLRILATTYLEQADYYRGEYQGVVKLATNNLATLPAEWTYEYLGNAVPTSVYDRCMLVRCLAHLGRFAEAAEHEIEAIRLAEPTQHAYTICQAHFSSGMSRLLVGDWAKASTLLERAIDVLQNGNVVLMFSPVVASYAWALAQLGHGREAMDRSRQSEHGLEHPGKLEIVGLRGWAYHALGRASLMFGQLDEAQRLAERAIASSQAHTGFIAQSTQLLGDIAIHSDRFDAERGEALYRQTIAIAEPRDMRPLVAHSHLGLGKIYWRRGKSDQARRHLVAATTMYREMQMNYWLKMASHFINMDE